MAQQFFKNNNYKMENFEHNIIYEKFEKCMEHAGSIGK